MGDVAAALTWPLSRPLHRAGTMPPFGGVRRCLFGPVDHEKSRVYQEEEYRKIQLENKKKWDFDFVNATPVLGGRYCWDPVQEAPVKDSDGEAEEKKEIVPAQVVEQTQITKFFRKRKSTSPGGKVPKTRRRSST